MSVGSTSTGCGRYLAAGGSLAALQQILGHASIKTTELYARLLHEHVMEDARRVEGVRRDKSRDKNGDNREAVV